MRLACAVLALVLAGPATAETGIASWYGRESGHRTANGEPFPTAERTCAHRSVHFGTKLRVTDISTGRSIVCRVNDRGPFVAGRVIDLNPASARALGMTGTARVRLSIE